MASASAENGTNKSCSLSSRWSADTVPAAEYVRPKVQPPYDKSSLPYRRHRQTPGGLMRFAPQLVTAKRLMNPTIALYKLNESGNRL